MRNQNGRIKAVIGCIITLGLIIMSLRYSTDLMERKSSDLKYAAFFKQEADFDVLFMGSSHVINGIFPMELWNDYGIVSYNFGGHGNRLATSYWVMENAFDYTSPQLIVVDCYMLSDTSKIVPDFSHTHSVFDTFPLSKTKVNAVFDLMEMEIEEEETDTDNNKRVVNRMELLWNYTVYHSRWNELEEVDFQPEAGKEKGAESRIAVRIPERKDKIPAESKLEEDTISVEYLEKMIQDCQNREIDVLLTYLPFPAGEKAQREANRVYDIAERYGVNYINFLDMDIVSRETDYYDNDHLNPSGAKKVTDYLGQYIMEHYSISDQRENIVYSDWYTDYADYAEYKISNLRMVESLDNYLMLLADKNYSVVVEINDPLVWNYDSYIHLFENLGVNSSEITKNTDFIVIQEAGRQAVCFENFHESGSHEMTAMGEFSLFMSETGDYGVFLDNEELYTVTGEENINVNIRIITIDKSTAEIVDKRSFSNEGEKAR